ncbi:MAG: MBL fold metallo-hydrolase [Bacteroidales bacterium]|jgi:metallo-beta-lactamase family protein|nr:MBL fold metallo-hydrolase [Bacteroidales bacterium]MDD4213509.1 MBL fold metallo-hydrolase [Bacteroidales bacterium]
MKITFLGAAKEVTGSKHLITTDDGKKILLDCGMFQGKGEETDRMNRNLGFNPKDIDYLILSHAHIDHSGLIPYIVKQGFEGMIICTHATRDLCAIMLQDSGRIQENDTKTYNKKLAKKGLPPVEPIYTAKDAMKSMQYFVSIAYGQKFRITDNVKLTFTDTGHILGSAATNLIIKENERVINFCYTSDIGRQTNSILRTPQPFPQADIIITESTYGNRMHEIRKEANNKLLKTVLYTCMDKKGKLIIPSFSVGRTQEVVYALNQLEREGRLPKIKTFVDSPLSVNATNIYRMHSECFNKEILQNMEKDPDPFGFNNLTYIQAVEDSKRLNELKEPCIIISSSGMMEAGRIKHHLANNISDPKNTILIVGYCEPRTLGARIKRGDKQVSIHGNIYDVKADITSLEEFSAHGDYAEMIVYLSCQDKKNIKKMFLVHGEEQVIMDYKRILEENRFSNIFIPEKENEYLL